MRLYPLHKTCEKFDPEEFTAWEKKMREAPVCKNDGFCDNCETCQAKRFAAKGPTCKFVNCRTSPF